MNRETYWKLRLALERLKEAENRLEEAIAAEPEEQEEKD